MTKHAYKVELERDGRWWMVHVPEIDELTQARRLGEAELMARELIALSTGTALADVSVCIVSITVPQLGDVAIRSRELIAEKDAAARAAANAQRHAADYARTLTSAGVPVRDVAELLGVSPQRVSQLTQGD
ncbi:hypothetical protein [Mycobacterium talmoniae]|uniref:HicB family toxin-antitoxin system n=1 Tax=Mycobacterium talmoniae TaxID=1858794 RepID=A0A1S1MTQ4_9MYCO|nr:MULTISPECIES: hypothetical protein [Mycobacterium]OHU89889.1 hypothetical protein BKN37_25690 [Mycobacterium talmoniae]PQM46939.1 hypothetical protein C1Y40_02884 [Mycobacterium talmoniae]TDH48722.1 HicB family toxin-antitoxin system [Mycobacterium eburneum]